jgi:hypothetical protein
VRSAEGERLEVEVFPCVVHHELSEAQLRKGDRAWCETLSRRTRNWIKGVPGKVGGHEIVKLSWSRRSGVNPVVVR